MSESGSNADDKVDEVQVKKSDKLQAKKNDELLQLAKKDEDAELKSLLLANGNAPAELYKYFSSKGESLLQASIEASGGSVSKSKVARMLLLELKIPEEFDDYLASDSCNYLTFEVQREGCDDLIKKVFQELNDIDEFSDCLDACVRAAASCKDKKFLEECLKVACGDKWLKRIQSCDRMKRNSLHHAAISANFASLRFLDEEFDDLQYRFDKNHKSFCEYLVELHLESRVSDILSIMVDWLDPDVVDEPANSNLTALIIDDWPVRDYLPPRLAQLLMATKDCDITKAQLVKEIVNMKDRSYEKVSLIRTIMHLDLLSTEDLDKLDLPNLVSEGKVGLVKELLMLRQSDIGEQAVLLHTKCRELKESSGYNGGLEDLEQFTASVCLNWIDRIYSICGNRLDLQKMVHKRLMQPQNDKGESFLETAKHIPGIFATLCFKEMVDRYWQHGIAYLVKKEDCGLQSAVTPRNRFFIHTAAFIIFFIFLAVYVHVLQPYFQFMDIVMIVYCISFFLQEVHELIRVGKRHATIWKAFDLAPIGIFCIGLLLKLIVVVISSNQDSAIFYNCRVILAFAFLMFGFKFLSIMRAPESFGPFISMIKALFLRDLLPFLGTLYAALVVCSGVFFHALLHPGGRSYDSHGAIKSLNDTDSYWNIYILPLLLTFGEMQMDTHQSCLAGEADQNCPHLLGNKIYTRALIYIFLIIVNLLLFNLLIARFSLTVTMKDERSHHIWRRYRYELLQEFSEINVIPPPINLPSILLAKANVIPPPNSPPSNTLCKYLHQLYHRAFMPNTLPAKSNLERKGKGGDPEEEEFLKFQALAMYNYRKQLSRVRCDEGSGLEKLQNEIELIKDKREPSVEDNDGDDDDEEDDDEESEKEEESED